MKKMLAAALSALLGLASAFAMAGPNLVTNGDFEDGTAGWTISGVTDYWFPDGAHSGNLAMGTGCVGLKCVTTQGSGSYFSQHIDTTAGSTYTLNLWVGERGGPTSEFSVFWDGNKVDDVVNPANNSLNNGNNWVEYVIMNLLASSSDTTLEIHGRQDPSGIFFDDVSVSADNANTVPEPGSFALLGLGLVSAFSLRRR